MNDKNGIYLSINDDDAVRVIIENSTKVQTDRIKISDELIGELEYDQSGYSTVFEHIRDKAEPLDDMGMYSDEQVADVTDLALQLAEAIRENDLTTGVLLRAAIKKYTDTNDDGSAMFFLATMNGIIDELQALPKTRYILYKYLKSRGEFETNDKWLETKVLPEGYFFRRDYPCEIINYDLFTNEPRLSQVFFFDNYSDYFVFLFLKFAEQHRRVLECPCCGKLFVPRSNRAEIYCDRLLINGKTCKQIAPKLMRKYKQMKDTLLDEYEHTKNRNYKRVERYENSNGDSSVIELTFDEYSAWLDRASRARRLYLQGKISKEQFRDVIKELDG